MPLLLHRRRKHQRCDKCCVTGLCGAKKGRRRNSRVSARRDSNFQCQSRAVFRVPACVAAVRWPVVRCSGVRFASSLCAPTVASRKRDRNRGRRGMTSVQEEAIFSSSQVLGTCIYPVALCSLASLQLRLWLSLREKCWKRIASACVDLASLVRIWAGEEDCGALGTAGLTSANAAANTTEKKARAAAK